MLPKPQVLLLSTLIVQASLTLDGSNAQAVSNNIEPNSDLDSSNIQRKLSSSSQGLYSVAQNANKQFPLSTIGQLANGCTGFLIGPCHVMTVAHCVHEPWNNIWWGGLDFYPGRNVPISPADASVGWAPLGTATKKDAVLHPNWTNAASSKGKPAADAAIIILNEPIGKQIGWLDYRLPKNIQFQLERQNPAADGGGGPLRAADMDQLVTGSGLSLHVAGYPDNKPNGSMWEQCCHPIDWALQGNLLWHDCSVRGGNSGSPVWVEWPATTAAGNAAAESGSKAVQQQQQHLSKNSLRNRLLLAQQPQQQVPGSASGSAEAQQDSRIQVVAIHSSSLKFPADSDMGSYAESVYADELAKQRAGTAGSRAQCVAGAGGREAESGNVLLPVAVPFTEDTYKWIEDTLQEHTCS